MYTNLQTRLLCISALRALANASPVTIAIAIAIATITTEEECQCQGSVMRVRMSLPSVRYFAGKQPPSALALCGLRPPL